VIICQVAKCISMLTFLHCEQFSFKAYIWITTCLNVLLFAIYVGNAFFKCSVRFILNIFIIVWLYLSWKNAICTTFWTGAVVRYYGNWKWCCSYSVCHKPLKFGHLVGNKKFLTKIMKLMLLHLKANLKVISTVSLFIEQPSYILDCINNIWLQAHKYLTINTILYETMLIVLLVSPQGILFWCCINSCHNNTIVSITETNK